MADMNGSYIYIIRVGDVRVGYDVRASAKLYLFMIVYDTRMINMTYNI